MKPSHGTLLAVLTASALGCEPEFDHFDFQARNVPPHPVEVGSKSVELTKGMALAVLAEPIDDDGSVMSSQVELSSSDVTVFGCDPAIEDRSFVFYGVLPGEAEMFVSLDGELQGTIPVTVLPQEN